MESGRKTSTDHERSDAIFFIPRTAVPGAAVPGTAIPGTPERTSLNERLKGRAIPDRSIDDQLLWATFRAGSKPAFDYLFETHIRLLYRYGHKMTKDQALVEDCIQDLFIELWNKKELLSDTNSIKFYLFRSLRRRIIRKLSLEYRLGEKQDLSEDYDFEVEFSYEFALVQEQVTQEQKQQLQAALNQLSKRQREAIYLKFYEKMSYEEISSVMNLHLKSAYNLISQAIESLRKAFKASSKKHFLVILLVSALAILGSW